MMTVLFSMLFQSFHSYEHLAEKFSEKICHHEESENKAEFTHHHHVPDHCFVCEFTFSSFISPETNWYSARIVHAEIPYFYTKTETPDSFFGASYSLRGPPIFIV